MELYWGCLVLVQMVIGFSDDFPPISSEPQANILFPDQSVVLFYPVTKQGGPTETPLLPWQPGTDDESDSLQKLYFNVESDEGVIFRIRIKKNRNLFSKSISSNLKWQDAGCLYFGHIVGDHKSSVGMNLCNGMGSVVSGTNGEYLLEPVNKEELHKHEWHLNMVKAPHQTKTHHADHNEDNTVRRKRRATLRSETIDKKRNIEILVVADNKLVKKYGTEEATTYILTVMNMVSSLFRDKSLGVEINIVMAGLIFLKGDEPELKISHRADETLNNFCEWQSNLKSEIHHDHAILMTGLDICADKNAPCDTIGYAPIRGMCSATRSCTINEDRGLGVAFTIAHEIGHNLGMVHDGILNNCSEEGSIMGASLTTDTGSFFWSKCNQEELVDFLETGQAECLLEEVAVKSEFYNMTIRELPGQIYNADQQCKHVYGHQATVCKFDLPNGVDICRYLWCYVGGMRCETKFLPAAEGTPCDQDKWCRQGQCIPANKNKPEPINGGWDSWAEWSACTRSCGGGIQTRIRYCSNPSPRYGGKYCEGESKEYGRCNMVSCSDDEQQFRAMQCSKYDKEPFKGKFFKWLPVDNRFLSAIDKCKLFCRAEKYNFFFQMNDKVIDGTRCDDESNDICINGKCQHVGCDGQIWSDAEADKCGVCRGDGTTCETVRGLFSGRVTLNNYTTFLTLPKGSKNILIKEMRSSSSFVAVKSADRYLLNGNWTMDWPGKFNFVGTKFVYNRLYSGLETLYSLGPINETLEIQLLAVGSNPGIQYEYIVPVNTSSIRYTWNVTKTMCSESCGTGYEEIITKCVDSSGSVVVDNKCDISAKPAIGRLKCNTQPCQPRWVAQEWSECSRTCGGGKQKRLIACMQRQSEEDDRKVKSKFCNDLERPVRTRACNELDCKPEWRASNWSECSASCGLGVEKRLVTCISTGKKQAVLADSECDLSARPALHRQCINRQCVMAWNVTEWSQCSLTCGIGGTQVRQLVCISKEPGPSYDLPVDTGLCEPRKRPPVDLVRDCVESRQCSSWQTGDWSECFASCGESQKKRLVKCISNEGDVTDTCNPDDKPSEIQRCELPSCPTIATFQPTTNPVFFLPETTTPEKVKDRSCQDTKSWCASLAMYKYYCTRSYYRTVCCATCLE